MAATNTLATVKPRTLLLPLFLVVGAATGCPPAGGPDDAGGGGDSGPPSDAGSASLHDGGMVTDSGILPSGDAGAPSSDAGASCGAVRSDPNLGSLFLDDAFIVVDSAVVPDEIITTVAASAPNDTFRLFGLDGVHEEVVDLGVWPVLDETTTQFQVIREEDAAQPHYLSPFLVSNGTHLAAGYTLAFDTTTFVAPGFIATADDMTTRFIPADNNYSAAYWNEFLLINGTHVDNVSGDTGLYAARKDPSGGYIGATVATFPAEWYAASGYTVTTSNGLVIVGGYYSTDDSAATNHLLVVRGTDVDLAVMNEAPISLGGAQEVTSGGILGVAAFGDGIAVLRGEYGAPQEGIDRIQLSSLESGDVQVGTTAQVLRVDDACTSIEWLSTIGDDLLVAVRDEDGRRVVRIRQAS